MFLRLQPGTEPKWLYKANLNIPQQKLLTHSTPIDREKPLMFPHSTDVGKNWQP
ncbi:MAG TPA: hypothetical protein V6D50_16885 [Chroococcales cyanobacterium]